MADEQRIIAVTGATGRQGGAVVRHLVRDGWRVRALTRNPGSAKARGLAARNVEVVKADMADAADLRTAFRDAYGVYSVQNPMIAGIDGEIAQGRNVGDAAKADGVQHVVYGSAGTGAADTGVGSWDSKLAVEAHLAGLGLPVTVLRPMAFMELMTDKGFYPQFSTWHVMPKLMGGDAPVSWLSVEDLGAIAAMAFADPDRFVGVDLALTSDVCSIDECRAMWRDVTGKPPRRFPMPARLFERIVGTDLTTMWRWLRSVRFVGDPAETRAILPAASTVRGWLTAQHLGGTDKVPA